MLAWTIDSSHNISISNVDIRLVDMYTQWMANVFIWHASRHVLRYRHLHKLYKCASNLVYISHLARHNQTIKQSLLVKVSRHVSCQRQLSAVFTTKYRLIEAPKQCGLCIRMTSRVLWRVQALTKDEGWSLRKSCLSESFSYSLVVNKARVKERENCRQTKIA